MDTSSIVFGFSFKKDVFAIARESFPGSSTLISAGVIRELRRLSKNIGKKGACAKIGLLSAGSKNVKVDNANGSVDAWICKAAARYNNAVVITNDTELHRKLRLSGASVYKLSRSGILKK